MSQSLPDEIQIYDISVVSDSGEHYRYPYWKTTIGYTSTPSYYLKNSISRNSDLRKEACYFVKKASKNDGNNSISEVLRFPPHLDYSGISRPYESINALKFYRITLDTLSGNITSKKLVKRVEAEKCS